MLPRPHLLAAALLPLEDAVFSESLRFLGLTSLSGGGGGVGVAVGVGPPLRMASTSSSSSSELFFMGERRGPTPSASHPGKPSSTQGTPVVAC